MKFLLKGRILKIFILVFIILFTFFTLAACSGKTTVQNQKEAVKIGLLVPYTGVFANNGYDITQGIELCFDEVGWKAAGRGIKLIKEDTEMNGQVALQKARRVIESEKVDILTGVVSSTVAYAIKDYVISRKVPFIIANAGASELTRDKKNKYIFRVSFSNGQYEYPMGIYAYNKLKFRKVVVLAPDYAAGHEKAKGFIDGFKSAGGEIIQEMYPKLGTTDYGPFLTQVMDADAVWVHFSGNDCISFVKQYEEYGLKRKIPLISTGDLLDEYALPFQGESALGIISSLHYSVALNTPKNREFVQNYIKKFEEEPNMYAEQGYVAAKVIVEALEAIDGDVSKKEKLLSAIRKVKFEAPRGPFRFDPTTQNVIFNVYIRKVEKKNGKLINEVIDTIPNVSDYWKSEN